jgi:hypothetical protein
MVMRLIDDRALSKNELEAIRKVLNLKAAK